MPLNALTPIVLTESGTCSSVILVHPENALFPMLVIVFGIVTLTRLVQPEKALSPMLVPGGIIAVSREVHFWNVSLGTPVSFVVFRIVIFFNK